MSVKKQLGFTLLELMITVAILAILSALAYPNMRNFMRHNQVVSQSNSLQSNLMYARGAGGFDPQLRIYLPAVDRWNDHLFDDQRCL